MKREVHTSSATTTRLQLLDVTVSGLEAPYHELQTGRRLTKCACTLHLSYVIHLCHSTDRQRARCGDWRS